MCDTLRSRPEMRDEHAVIRQGRGQIDPSASFGEARHLLDRRTWWHELEGVGGDHGLAEGNDVLHQRPAPLENLVAPMRPERIQHLLVTVLPRPERHTKNRASVLLKYVL